MGEGKQKKYVYSIKYNNLLKSRQNTVLTLKCRISNRIIEAYYKSLRFTDEKQETLYNWKQISNRTYKQ